MMFFGNKKDKVKEETVEEEVISEEIKEEDFIISDYAMERYKKSTYYNDNLTNSEVELLFCSNSNYTSQTTPILINQLKKSLYP